MSTENVRALDRKCKCGKEKPVSAVLISSKPVSCSHYKLATRGRFTTANSPSGRSSWPARVTKQCERRCRVRARILCFHSSSASAQATWQAPGKVGTDPACRSACMALRMSSARLCFCRSRPLILDGFNAAQPPGAAHSGGCMMMCIDGCCSLVWQSGVTRVCSAHACLLLHFAACDPSPVLHLPAWRLLPTALASSACVLACSTMISFEHAFVGTRPEVRQHI